LDSISALTIAGDLEDMLGMQLPATLLWDSPTINDLADSLAQMISER
jgi:acyl carrier protein